MTCVRSPLLCPGRPSAAAFAQTPLPSRVTLEEALARAAANSHRLAELRAREAAGWRGARPAQGRRSADRGGAGRIPADESRRGVRVSADTARSRCSIPTSRTIGARGSTCSGPSTPAAARRRWSARRRPNSSATGKELESARADLRLETTRAFWALVTAIESVAVVDESREAHRGATCRRAGAVRRGVPAAQRRADGGVPGLPAADAADPGQEPARWRPCGAGAPHGCARRMPVRRSTATLTWPRLRLRLLTPASRRLSRRPSHRADRDALALRVEAADVRSRPPSGQQAGDRAGGRLRLRATEHAALPAGRYLGGTRGTSAST